MGKLGQGIHALQDAIAHAGIRTNDHLGLNSSSVSKFGNYLYGDTKKASNLTRSAGILTRLLSGKAVKFEKDEELNFKGMSNEQFQQTIKLLVNAGFSGKIQMN